MDTTSTPVPTIFGISLPSEVGPRLLKLAMSPMFWAAPTESAFLAPAMLVMVRSEPLPAAVTKSCRDCQTEASIFRSTTDRPSQTSADTPRLELITSAFCASPSPQAVGSANQSIARPQPSADAPPSLLTDLAKRMSWTSGAMPARCGFVAPLPSTIPVTWVPWPMASIHRSWSCWRDTAKLVKLAPQMLRRFVEMSGWSMLSPVSITPTATVAPPTPVNIADAAS